VLGNAQNIAEVVLSGVCQRYPARLLPSEYLRRQIFGMYWFERQSLRSVIDLLADNLMFETDFPHATSLSPGPASESPSPRGGDGALTRRPARGDHRPGAPAHRDQALPPGDPGPELNDRRGVRPRARGVMLAGQRSAPTAGFSHAGAGGERGLR
jgi:hypothetical protein